MFLKASVHALCLTKVIWKLYEIYPSVIPESNARRHRRIILRENPTIKLPQIKIIMDEAKKAIKKW